LTVDSEILMNEGNDSALARTIVCESGQNPGLCYQCKKCASGCPVSYTMDLSPTEVIHALQLGQAEMVLESDTIWICASCETCTTRCPQEIDIARVMDAARITAQRTKIKPKRKDVLAFYRTALQNIFRFGRMYELWMIASLKFKTLDFFKDLELGTKMLKKRKLKWAPAGTDVKRLRRIIKSIHKLEREERSK
jgi:heterodisulfide reductase subunit C